MNTLRLFKPLTWFALFALFMGCGNNSSEISFNPFEPNYDLKTHTIIANGFQLKWACDGGFNTYSFKKENYELLFFEDCNDPGKIIGEDYCFRIDSIENFDWHDSDSLIFDFSKYRDTILSIIDRYNGKLIEPKQLVCYRRFEFSVLYKNDSLFDCQIYCDPDGIVNLSIENWYRN